MGSWQGGFQIEVGIAAAAGASGRAWTVRWTYPAGTGVQSLWNGVLDAAGSGITVRNAAHNGTPPATFGFVGAGPAAAPSGVTCALA